MSATKPKTYEEVEAARKAHIRLCEEKNLPLFAPTNGVCWACYRQIFEVLDGTSFITGCPYCHRSYCD